MEVTWPQIYLDEITFPEIRQFFFVFKCKIVIQYSTTRDKKILIEVNIQ